MIYPHIRPALSNTTLQGFYALEGRKLPQEIYDCWIQADVFDANQQYWIQKLENGIFFRVRIDRHQPQDLPPLVVSTALSIDTGRLSQFKLYVGNDIDSLEPVLQDENSNRRHRLLLSLC